MVVVFMAGASPGARPAGASPLWGKVDPSQRGWASPSRTTTSVDGNPGAAPRRLAQASQAGCRSR
jgi:hypothetical protein